MILEGDEKIPSQYGSSNIYSNTVYQRILLNSEDEMKSTNGNGNLYLNAHIFGTFEKY